MTTESHNDLLNEDLLTLNVNRRKKLVPLWIKIFCWIFIAFAVLVPVAVIFAIAGSGFTLSLYSLETSNPFSITGITLLMLFAFKGIVAYSILKEKDRAVQLAIIDAVTGIILCVVIMISPAILQEGNRNFSFKPELLLLIPYLVKMLKIKPAWEGNMDVE